MPEAVCRRRASLHLLSPKWQSMRARATKKNEGAHGTRHHGSACSTVGVLGVHLRRALHRLLAYFRGVPEIGPLLAGKLLGLMLVSFFGILLLSNIITALSSFFLAHDLDLLVAAPVDWLRLYVAKLLETCAYSSWMVVLLAVPMFAAYGLAYDGGPLFVLVVIAAFVPFLDSAGSDRSGDHAVARERVSGAAHARHPERHRGAGGRRLRPAVPARASGAARATGGIPVAGRVHRRSENADVAVAAERVGAAAVMGWLTGTLDILPFYLLWSTAAAFLRARRAAPSPLLYERIQQGAGERASAGRRKEERRSLFRRVLAPLGIVRRELVLKELRLFFRDTTQWSQLILLAVLVVVYVFNIKFLPLRGQGVTFFLANLIPFLNLVLAGFVLASIAARFIFPGVSLEGRTMWLLRSSPLPMRDLLWSKFWVGTIPLLVLALALVVVTGSLMHVSDFIMLYRSSRSR